MPTDRDIALQYPANAIKGVKGFTPLPVGTRLLKAIQKTETCWFWTGATAGRYGYISVLGKRTKVHRLMYQLTKGPIPMGLFVCHECDNSLCVNPEHLFLGTQTDNMRDCALKGRHGSITTPESIKRGRDNNNAKLSDADILKIRALRDSGVSQRKIANIFGVTQFCIWRILSGKGWNHVI